MRLPRMFYPFEGWRRTCRLQLQVGIWVGFAVYLLLQFVEGWQWFGLAVFGLAWFHVGFKSILVLASGTYTAEWLETSVPRDMRYRLVLQAVLSLGFASGSILKAYTPWLGGE